MMPRFCALIILLTASSISTKRPDCDYEDCADVLHPGKYIQHTMCLYPLGPSAQCTNVTQERLNVSDETKILDFHNELRQKVANGNETRSSHGILPTGNIPALSWDTKLAEIAQRWAHQCLNKEDVCRNFGIYRIGQNLGFRSSQTQVNNIDEILVEWSREVEDFKPLIINSYKRYGIFRTDRYTQMIWGNTTHIGCGGTQYVNTRRLFATFLVCNYRTEGNIDGDAVYEITHQS